MMNCYPPPWTYSERTLDVRDADGNCVLTCRGPLARLIVRAVNAHGPILAMLRIREWFEGDGGGYCLTCGMTKSEGHRIDCELRAALDLAEKE